MSVIRTTRTLLAGAAIAIAGVVVATATPAVAAPQHAVPPVTAGSYYLALGDSVVFGYRESQSTPMPDYTNAASFNGYPELVGQAMGLKVVNASCPGETSGSFIKTTRQSNGCEADAAGNTANGYRTNFPLHTSYSGSQLAFAESFLKAHPKSTKLVTLMIGANDGLICQGSTADQCTSPTEIGAVVAKVEKHVSIIVKDLRKTGYAGQFLVVNYYSPDYTNTQVGAAETLGTEAINNALDTGARPNNNQYKVHVATAFGAFKKAAEQTAGDDCTAGLLTILTGASTPCGVHPSVAGQFIIANKVIEHIRY